LIFLINAKVKAGQFDCALMYGSSDQHNSSASNKFAKYQNGFDR